MTTLLNAMTTRLAGLLARACGTTLDLAPRCESLEGRTLLAVNVISPIADSTVQSGATALVVNLAGRYDNPDLNGTIVKFATDMGDINVLMYDQSAAGATRTTPQTVANFLRYMNDGKYNQTVFHRSARNFVIQGGGFTRPTSDGLGPSTIATYAAVQNEPGNTNVRGTIAMAKQGGNANSATNQWFFNLANNASNLDAQNGGFTVFGRIIKGLDVMDAIANVDVWDLGSPFDTLPLRGHVQNAAVRRSEYVGMNISAMSELSYSVTSSNTAVANPTLDGTNLTVSYGAAGTANLTVRVTCADGTVVDDVFTVRVNSAPFIAGLTPGSSTVGRNSAFTLTVPTVIDDAGVSRIDFYRDVNGNNTLEVGVDSLVGTDTSSTGGWSASISTSGLSLGTYRYFAIATDGDGLTSTSVTNTVQVVNAAPVVSAFTASPNPAEGIVPVTLSATVTDPDGSVAFVRFYRDTNNNGTLDMGTDALVGEDTDGGNGYSVVVDTFGTTFGATRYFAQGTDLEAQAGAAASVVSVLNAPFSVGSLTPSVASILRGGQVTLTAANVFIPAGKVFKTLEFYADTNNNGVFDVADKKVGSASSIRTGTATVNVSTKGLPVGACKYFARVQNTLNEWSPAAAASVEVLNNAPTLTSVKTSAAIIKNLGDVVSLTVSGQKDVDGTVTMVKYYRDVSAGGPADGVFDAAVDTLLGTVTTSAGSWKLTVSSSAFAVGANRFYAVAYDNNGAMTSAVTTLCTVNAAPTIGSFVVTPDTGTVLLTTFTFNAGAVADADGTVKQVEFFLDADGDGLINTRVDRSLGKGKLVAGLWTMTLGVKKLPAGTVKLMARATDNLGGLSAISNATVTLT
jgi:cyclophilin family peptidyl-prolyl cis-trans isomerase